MSSLQKMLKKAQQMQNDVESAQDQLADMEIEYAGNGVRVVALGNFTVKSVEVEADLLESADDKEMLEDCMLVAINGALNKVREEMDKKAYNVYHNYHQGTNIIDEHTKVNVDLSNNGNTSHINPFKLCN